MSLDEQSVIGNEGIRAVAGYRLSVFIAYWNYYLNLAIQHTSDVYVNSAINPPTVLTSQKSRRAFWVMSLDEQSVIGNEGIRAVAGYRLSVFIAYWNYYLNLAIQHTKDVYSARMYDF